MPPPEAAYQVWSIDRISAQQTDSEHQFFDAQLKPLNRRQNLGETFDPRSRPWYHGALESAAHFTTVPYVFFSSREVGTTIARKSNADTVIGADLTLDDLSATLAAHQLTPSTEVVLYSNDGSVVAYPDSSRLVIPGQTLQLAPVHTLSPVLATFRALNVKQRGKLSRFPG